MSSAIAGDRNVENSIFWDTCKNRLFGGTYRLNHQGGKNQQARNNISSNWLSYTANVVPSSPILVTLMIERYIPPKRRFLQEPHGVTSQKTAFFIDTAVKSSNLT
jgi:hypothetical protein